MNSLRLVLFAALVLAIDVTAQPVGVPVEIASVSGKNLKIIEAAMPEFTRRQMPHPIDACQIRVLELANDYAVIFDYPNRKHGELGSPAGFPVLEVILRKDDLKVIESHSAK